MIEIVAICLAVVGFATLPFLLGWSPVIGALGAALVWGWSSGRHPHLASVALFGNAAAFFVGMLVAVLFGAGYAILPLVVSLVVFVIVGLFLSPASPSEKSAVEVTE